MYSSKSVNGTYDEKWERISVSKSSSSYNFRSRQSFRNGIPENFKGKLQYSSSENEEEIQNEEINRRNGGRQLDRVSHFSVTDDEGCGGRYLETETTDSWHSRFRSTLSTYQTKLWHWTKVVTAFISVPIYWALVQTFVFEKWILNRRSPSRSRVAASTVFAVPRHPCLASSSKALSRSLAVAGSFPNATAAAAKKSRPWPSILPFLFLLFPLLLYYFGGFNPAMLKSILNDFVHKQPDVPVPPPLPIVYYPPTEPSQYPAPVCPPPAPAPTCPPPAPVPKCPEVVPPPACPPAVPIQVPRPVCPEPKCPEPVCPVPICPVPVCPSLPASAPIHTGADINVERLIKEAIEKYDADKTGRPDLALESGGGSVVSTRCTKKSDYVGSQISVWNIPVWWASNNPRKSIQPGTQPGDCWSFDGAEGFLVIKLVGPTRVTGFTMEHLSKTLSPLGHIQSAPRRFQVVGHMDYNDYENEFLFGEYEYLDDGNPVQYFEAHHQSDKFYPYVELKILSNHGSVSFTCLYRFRVHGYLESWTALMS